MCYKYKSSVNHDALREEFHVAPELDLGQFDARMLNGFDHPDAPIILDTRPGLVVSGQWGLLPHWAKDNTLQKNTLNCMIETAAEKPSFKDSVKRRCLILAEEFYEYKWEEPGKPKCKKHMYAISAPGRRAFAMAGIYNTWNGTTTFTIITTDANELMAEIHNNKKRMPVVLHKEEQELWLQGDPLGHYLDRTELELQAVPVESTPPPPPQPVQGSFF